MNNVAVSLNRGAIKSYIKARIVSTLSDKVASWSTHDNTDGKYSPAEWWYAADKLTRYTLETTMACSMSGDTVRVCLSYTPTIKSQSPA
ncbi:MAG: hypothetical protein R3Y56_02345 [Akkermansia sp.]